jgi:hypothetical protein
MGDAFQRLVPQATHVVSDDGIPPTGMRTYCTQVGI